MPHLHSFVILGPVIPSAVRALLGKTNVESQGKTSVETWKPCLHVFQYLNVSVFEIVNIFTVLYIFYEYCVLKSLNTLNGVL